MSDGKVIIETDLDSSGAEKGLKNLGNAVQKGLKVSTAAIATFGTSMSAAGAVAVKVGSDFESQMSRVKAISQATEEEFEQLRKQAVKLGADTAFSSSEAAQGMENLAAAGFSTSEIMAAMPGLLDLAAASGEDLASSSDIAASAINGFGLEASDAAHVADVLAANANKTNSSVADTGEAMKYIAPLARTAGISLEETAAAIGLMANAGVQGSQAGTTLRGAISRLSKPTNDMTEVMDALGISFYNSNGKMKSLAEQVGMLRGAMEGMTDEQKNNYLVTLYGQEALSGMTALINEGEEALVDLTNAYKTCDGSAKEAADTMLDNFKGSMEQLGGSLESFGILIFDSVSEPLKETAQDATESVNEITDAFKSGGMKGAILKAGQEFDKFADNVSESNEVIGGIIEPIENLSEAGLNLGKKVLPIAADGFGLVAKNLDILIPSLVAGVTAYKGYSIVNSVNSGIKSMSATVAMLTAAEKANALQVLTASGALTTKEVVIGIVTGKITLATAAQAAWNAVMNANPIGLLITGVTALAAGIGVYALVTDNATESNGKLTKEQEKLLDSCYEVTTAMEKAREAREKNVQSIDMEYDNYESLLSELQSITDVNGKVKAGYEDRAKVISGQLSDALGKEIELTDGVIQNYQETIDVIKEVIVQKKAEALLNSMQSEMAEAYQKTSEAMQSYKDAASVVEEKNKAVEAASARVKEAQAAYDEAIQKGSQNSILYANNLDAAKATLQEAEAAQNKAAETMDTAKESMSALATEVDNYNALAEAMVSGETAKIEAAITALVTAYRSYSEEALSASKETRQEMYDQANDFVENMQLIQDGSVEVADSVYQDMARATVNSIKEFNKLPGGLSQGIKDIGPKASAAMVTALAQANLDGKLGEEAKEDVRNFIAGFGGLDEETKEVWSEAWYGALEGLEGFESLADPAEEGVDTFLKTLKKLLEVHSPSKAVKKIFAQVWPGASEGLEEGQDELEQKGTSVVQNLLKKIEDSDLLNGAKEAGQKIMSFFVNGIDSKNKESEEAGRENAKSADSGAGSINPTKTGNAFGSLLSKGILSMGSLLKNSGTNIANSADSGAKNVNPYGTGNTFGNLLSNGISAMSRTLWNAGTTIANNANGGAGNVSPYGTGQNFSSVFASGINAVSLFASGQGRARDARDGLGNVSAGTTGNNFILGFIDGMGWNDVWDAAWNIGKRALAALKKSIQEGSPSKLTRKSGGFFGEGFELGILDEEKAVAEASERLGAVALGGIDIAGLAQRAREVVSFENARYGKAISANKISGSQNSYNDTNITQNVHIHQPVKNPVETARALRRAGKELAYA